MNIDEKQLAREIYVAMLNGWVVSGRPLLGNDEAERYAAQAIAYSLAFDRAVKKV